jgi:5-methylcytosine-specific restriction endonuclease McrA
MIKVCELDECTNEFEDRPVGSPKKYCSQAHRGRDKGRRKRAREAIAKDAMPTVYRTCELGECGKEFKPNRPQQKYCCPEHALRANYLENRTERLEYRQEYYETNRVEILESSSVYAKANRDSRNTYNRKRYATNQDAREKKLSRNRAYNATDYGYAVNRASSNQACAKERGAVMDPEFTAAILANILLNTLACEHCPNELTLRQRIIDHKLAIVNGGKHEESNIQILCDDCHKIKTVIDSYAAWDARAMAA